MEKNWVDCTTQNAFEFYVFIFFKRPLFIIIIVPTTKKAVPSLFLFFSFLHCSLLHALPFLLFNKEEKSRERTDDSHRPSAMRDESPSMCIGGTLTYVGTNVPARSVGLCTCPVLQSQSGVLRTRP